ncbi:MULTISPECIES: RNA polymerase sigma factor [Sphingomonas]|uniref:RNA polymerase sigma factor n=1 Tax=Sphingomonas lycopersici TaxID=2951807 RepID=A0AA41Z5N0_9SPHN|nr:MULTISPECIES: RNA polymerase sigma factor [Sphingomonas]MCW6531903.1 RNA polymerase sigma factor [Sphingomonas lycopersici]MCW6533995.1 RNA polymerase sigma factor [Sphingomonas lycopersici]
MSQLTEMWRHVRGVLRKRGVADQDADDLVQEAFLKVEYYERKHEVRSQEALLVRIAVNLSIDEQRRERRAPFANENVFTIVDTAPDSEQVLQSRARLKHASDGLAQLPERTRRILLRRRLDGASYATIAREEGMSIAAVEKRIARATLELMNWMEQW